jgi:hypothetical protein
MGMATVIGNTALGFLTTEAASLLAQAKKYRDEMNALPADDPRRKVYEEAIRDLVDRANRISTTVTTTITSTSSFTNK